MFFPFFLPCQEELFVCFFLFFRPARRNFLFVFPCFFVLPGGTFCLFFPVFLSFNWEQLPSLSRELFPSLQLPSLSIGTFSSPSIDVQDVFIMSIVISMLFIIMFYSSFCHSLYICSRPPPCETFYLTFYSKKPIIPSLTSTRRCNKWHEQKDLYSPLRHQAQSGT